MHEMPRDPALSFDRPQARLAWITRVVEGGTFGRDEQSRADGRRITRERERREGAVAEAHDRFGPAAVARACVDDGDRETHDVRIGGRRRRVCDGASVEHPEREGGHAVRSNDAGRGPG